MPDDIVVFLLIVVVAIGIGCIYSNCESNR
jgi:hypothetical protein